MMKNIQIFDVDGTLTHHEKDFMVKQKVNFDTFAFWPLISSHFCKDQKRLKIAIEEWEKKLAGEQDPDKSSWQFLSLVIKKHLNNNISSEQIINYAESITNTFIEQEIIHLEAIKYLNTCLESGTICVLTTGSYLDGLKGFILSLLQHKLIVSSENLVLHGAEVNWREKIVTHANVGQYKVNKLKHFLTSINTPYKIRAVFGDDPIVNDKQLFNLVPNNNAFVIKCHKNSQLTLPYIHCLWYEYLRDHKNRIITP